MFSLTRFKKTLIHFLKALLKAILIISIISLCLCIWSFRIELDTVTVKTVNLRIPKWHQEHKNLKIAVIADIHAGSPFIDVKKLNQIVELTNREKPDLILMLGDYMVQEVDVKGGKTIEAEVIAKSLKKLEAPLGIISVLGNHDWWYGGMRVQRALEKANITVLENNAVKITTNNKSFWVAGLADLWTRNPDVSRTLFKSVKDNNPVILLTHNPDLFPIIPSKASLTLAGHTHGGQVLVPFLGAVKTPSIYGKRYAAGHIIEDVRHLFVSSGIGTSIIPVRFFIPPEIVILRLESQN